MYTVYALYSKTHGKIYIGYTSNIELHLNQHNISAIKGYTTKYRPWDIVYTEKIITKKEAMLRERQLKSAKGRKLIREIISEKEKLQ